MYFYVRVLYSTACVNEYENYSFRCHLLPSLLSLPTALLEHIVARVPQLGHLLAEQVTAESTAEQVVAATAPLVTELSDHMETHAVERASFTQQTLIAREQLHDVELAVSTIPILRVLVQCVL